MTTQGESDGEMNRNPRHPNGRAAETLQITCVFPAQVRTGLWRVVWSMSATLLLAATTLALLAVLAPRSLDTQIMGEPQRNLEIAERWYVL
jgi:hypothetical protein